MCLMTMKILHYLMLWKENYAEILLENGANINFRSDSGQTALHYAAELGKLEIVEFLLKNNANIDCIDENLDTPLFIAMENEHVEVLEILLQKGANVNFQDEDLRTPLFHASPKMAKLIFDYATDLDLEIRDEEDRSTAFEHNLELKMFDIFKMIVFHQNMQP